MRLQPAKAATVVVSVLFGTLYMVGAPNPYGPLFTIIATLALWAIIWVALTVWRAIHSPLPTTPRHYRPPVHH
jgi:hypothetical protein